MAHAVGGRCRAIQPAVADAEARAGDDDRRGRRRHASASRRPRCRPSRCRAGCRPPLPGAPDKIVGGDALQRGLRARRRRSRTWRTRSGRSAPRARGWRDAPRATASNQLGLPSKLGTSRALDARRREPVGPLPAELRAEHRARRASARSCSGERRRPRAACVSSPGQWIL